ncbi:PepSY-associated TM helix domain-containing protein [Burkholderia guangdongensis]|uniref:PepSY-associated TM helix domain-containing protein n=1 Tax=Burkholderia guangdongensis TaxID=1792500 RepID=UPI0015CB2DAB|nr:PepSY domain-containing protein [Burkholderia guangdongensis]
MSYSTSRRLRARARRHARSAITVAGPGTGYRTLWRWHFYAGLFVMPFLVVLAITGTIYCFQPQIEPLLYPHQLVVTPRPSPRLDEDALLAGARAAMPPDAVATTARISARADRSAEFVFRLPDGRRESVYLNPYDGTVLGALDVDRRFMQVDRMIHRKLLLGKPGELLMELVACWTLVMIGTGIALWWPRGTARVGRALLPDLSLRGRPLWKSIHAALGIWLAIGAFAFVTTGLPWTGSWGKHFQSLATSVKLGSPPGSWGGSPLRSTVPGQAAGAGAAGAGHASSSGMDAMPGMTMDDMPLPQVPWAVGAVRVPRSPDVAAPGARPLPLGRIVARMRAAGLVDGYDVALPTSVDGVYTVSYFPADPNLERTVHIDQYSGAVLKDIRYGDYGAVAKAVSYGTSLHMGRYFGLANQIVCVAISLGLAAMAVTGAVMWWKRRPAGTLGAPARERVVVPMRGWVAGLVLLGIVFPLMGATIVAVWLLDRLLLGPAVRPAAS